MSKAYIGTSGYIYDHWYSVFYPEDLTKDKWLEYYCKFFDTVELNVTFYRLPFESAFKGWYKRTPDNFLFTVKGSRFITHIKKLNDPKEPLELLFSRVKHLKEKLGMILWQLPPQFAKGELRKSNDPSGARNQKSKTQSKIQKFIEFCELLKKLSPPTVRHSFEFRHESWFCDEIYEILKKYNFALVICDYPFILEGAPMVGAAIPPSTRLGKAHPSGKVAAPLPLKTDRKQIIIPETADFIYLRRHGATALYASNYSDEQLKQDAEQIKKWLKSSKDVYIYFNNDAYGYAVKNALKLKELLK
jgi:uncharacterized protein YecE (DUF72 family)